MAPALTGDAALARLCDRKVRSEGISVQNLNLLDQNVKPLVALELPMYAENVEKVLETVGGLKNLQQTHEAKSQFLPVKLRPTEPSCKPLFADLTKTQSILLRVRRTKRKQRNDETSEEEVKYDISTQVVGLIKEKYVCEGMADFQFLTSKRFYPSNATDEKENSERKRIGQALRPYVKVVRSFCSSLSY